jgi:hypothetical protein
VGLALQQALAVVVAAADGAKHAAGGAVHGSDGAEGEKGHPFVSVLRAEVFQQLGLGGAAPPLTPGAAGAEEHRACKGGGGSWGCAGLYNIIMYGDISRWRWT